MQGRKVLKNLTVESQWSGLTPGIRVSLSSPLIFKTITTVSQFLVAVLRFLNIYLGCLVTHFVFATLMRALANNIGQSSAWQVEAGRRRLFSSSNGIESSIVIFLQQPWKHKRKTQCITIILFYTDYKRKSWSSTFGPVNVLYMKCITPICNSLLICDIWTSCSTPPSFSHILLISLKRVVPELVTCCVCEQSVYWPSGGVSQCL